MTASTLTIGDMPADRHVTDDDVVDAVREAAHYSLGRGYAVDGDLNVWASDEQVARRLQTSYGRLVGILARLHVEGRIVRGPLACGFSRVGDAPLDRCASAIANDHGLPRDEARAIVRRVFEECAPCP